MLKASLDSMREFLKELQKERMELRSHKQLVPAPLDDLELSSEVTGMWSTLSQVIKQDIYRYVPSDPEKLPEELAISSMAALQESLSGDPPAEAPEQQQPVEVKPPEQLFPELLQMEKVAPQLPSSLFTAHFVQSILPYFCGPDLMAMPPTLSRGNKLLLYRTLQDTEYLSNNLSNFGSVGLSTLQKLRKVEEFMLEGATENAMRLLKAARQADPHNNTLAHVFSQVEYYHANHGQRNALPDARSEGHKSASFNEAVDPLTLMQYRYDAASSERACSEKKAIEWLQEFYILDPEQTGGSGAGLAKNNAVHLKSWVLLSTIDSQLWGDYVFNSIVGLVQDTIGGASLYLHLLRPKVLKELKNRAVAPVGIEELEKKLQIAYASYLQIKSASEKWKIPSGGLLWTVRNRFLTDIYNIANFPSFDEILMNIALNGRATEKRAFPADALLEKGYEKEQYWRLWAIALSPESAQKNCSVLPYVETGLEKDFYHMCDKTLEKLQQNENDLINQEEWEFIHPYLPHLTLEHLLAASTRSDRPRSKFVPTTPPFNTYYREWGKGIAPSPLPSVLIRQNAQQGAFASGQEILAALEGANILVHDANYGLENQQILAIEIANKKIKRSVFSGGKEARKGGMPESQASIGDLMLYLFLPLVVASFLVFLMVRLFS